VANSQFDLSLLKPVDEKDSDFESQLTPIEESKADENARKKQEDLKRIMNITQHGFVDRPIDKLLPDAWNMAKDMGGTVASGMPALLGQTFGMPAGTASKNILAGLSSIPFNFGNMILNAPQYIAGLESERASNFLKKYTPNIPTEGIVNATFGEPNESDKKVRDLAAILPILFPIAKAGVKGTINTAKGAIGKTDKALEANEAVLGSEMREKQADLERKTEAAQAAEEAHESAVAESQRVTKKSNPNTMYFDINEGNKKIQNMTDEANQLQEQLKNTKPEETDLPTAEENVAKAIESEQGANELLGNVQDTINHHLNEGSAHRVNAAPKIANRVDRVINYWRDSYKKFLTDITDAQFHMPKEAMDNLDYSGMSQSQLIDTFGPDALDAIKKGKMDEFLKKQSEKKKSSGNTYLDGLTKFAPTSSDTSAATFISKYKDFGSKLYKLGQELRNPLVLSSEKAKIEAAYSRGKEMKAQMKKVLDEGLGKYKGQFDILNKGYSEEVYPLENNPLVNKARIAKLPKNIVEAASSSEDAMPLVREIIKQDPELLRDIIGERYFDKPSEVHNPGQLMREYLPEMPELNNLLKQHEQATSAVEQAKSNTAKAKEHHAEITKRDVEATKNQKQIDKLESDIAKHKKENEDMKKHMEELNKTRKEKKINLKAKLKAEKDFKKAEKDFRENSKQLDEKVTGLRKLYRIAKTSYKIGKKLI